MTKKHFIQLADTLRLEIKPHLDSEAFDVVARNLALFCKSQNAAFDLPRWIAYAYYGPAAKGWKKPLPATGGSR